MTVTTFTDSTDISRCGDLTATPWATARAASSCDNVLNPTISNATMVADNGDGSFKYLDRSYFLWDTSALGAGAVISTAKLVVYFAGKVNTTGSNLTGQILNGMATYPHNPVVVSDFDRTFYSGNGGQHSFKNDTVETWIDFPLNATGISWINKTGWTKFCMMEVEHDVNNVSPGSTGDTYTIDLTGGGTYHHKLEVTWTSGGSYCGASVFRIPIWGGKALRKIFKG